MFGESVVNAVLILIFASILIATLVAESQVKKVERPGRPTRAPGERVLVSVIDVDAAPNVLRLAHELAANAGGVVEAVLLRGAEIDREQVEEDLEQLHSVCVKLGLETEPTVQITADPAQSMVYAAIGNDASLVFAAKDGEHYAATLERLGAQRDKSGTWIV